MICCSDQIAKYSDISLAKVHLERIQSKKAAEAANLLIRVRGLEVEIYGGIKSVEIAFSHHAVAINPAVLG